MVAAIKPYVSAESLRARLESHMLAAQRHKHQVERILCRGLSSGELDLISDYIICSTHHRVEIEVRYLEELPSGTNLQWDLEKMSRYVAETREYLVTQVASAYAPWGISTASPEFANLLAWEEALARQLPE